MRNDLVVVWTAVATILVGVLVFLFNSQSNSIEAAKLSSDRIIMLDRAQFSDWDWAYSIAIFCDTETGTLLYSGGYRQGIWGLPNGCEKTAP